VGYNALKLLSALIVAVIAEMFLATPVYGSMTLTWQDNSNNEDGFIIEKQEDPPAPTSNVPWTLEGRVGANITTYVDFTSDTIRCFRVLAFNSAGNSTPSNVACVGLGVPDAPGTLKVIITITVIP